MLVIGMAFFAGGCKYRDQFFNLTVAQTSTALMGLGLLSMIVPAAFSQVSAPDDEVHKGILALSRGTAIILLVVYALYVFFQLSTHKEVLREREAKTVISWEDRKKMLDSSSSIDKLDVKRIKSN